jgi:hypothetical protein
MQGSRLPASKSKSAQALKRFSPMRGEAACKASEAAGRPFESRRGMAPIRLTLQLLLIEAEVSRPPTRVFGGIDVAATISAPSH